MDGTQVASLFGVLSLDDKMTPALKNSMAAIQDTKSGFAELGASLRGFGAQATALGTVPIIAFLTGAIKAASDTQTVLAQLDQELKVTSASATTAANAAGTLSAAHGAAATSTHMTRDAMIAMADGLSKTTRFSKDAVIGAEAMQLTFTNIGKDIFPEATQSILDMSTAMGQDLKSSTEMVDKALQDPIHGVTALQKVGVSLNDTQKETIKHFVAIGDTASAQKIILSELEHEFGGTAQAAGGTFAGQLDIAGHAVQGLMETIGMQLLPVLTSLATGAANVVNWVTDHLSPGMIQAGVVFALLVAAIGPVATILGSIGLIIGVVLSPIGLVVGAVIGLAAAFATNFGGIRDTVNSIWATVQPTLEKFKDIAGGFMKDLFPDNSNQATTQTMTVNRRINRGTQDGEDAPQATSQQTITTQAAAGPGFGDNLIKAISNALPKVQDALGELVASAGQWISTVGIPKLEQSIELLFGIDPKIFDSMTSTFGTVWNSTVQPALDAVSNGISEFIKNFSGADVSGIGVILKDLATGIGALVGGIVTVGLSIIQGIGNALGPLGDALKSFVNAISDVGNGNIGKFFDDMGAGLGKLVTAIATVPLSAAEQLGGLIGIDVKGGLASWSDFDGQISTIWNGLFVGDNSKLGKAITAGKQWVADLIKKFNDIKDGITNAFGGVADIITAPFRSAIRAIGEILKSIGDNGGLFSSLEGPGVALINFAGPKAAGGDVAGGSAYLVGEKGPELFVPGASGSIMTNDVLTRGNGGGGSSGGGGTTVIINNPVFQGVSDVGAMFDSLNREAGRRNLTLGVRA
jgi:phage-related protein